MFAQVMESACSRMLVKGGEGSKVKEMGERNEAMAVDGEWEARVA